MKSIEPSDALIYINTVWELHKIAKTQKQKAETLQHINLRSDPARIKLPIKLSRLIQHAKLVNKYIIVKQNCGSGSNLKM